MSEEQIPDIIYEKNEVYTLNGNQYWDCHIAVAKAINKDYPKRPPNYRFTYNCTDEGEEGESKWHSDDFSSVVHTAYYYPIGFKCDGLNKEEAKFIEALILYKIEEKLKR